MKKIVFPLPLLLLSLAFAEDANPGLPNTTNPPTPQPTETTPIDSKIYNLSARPAVKDGYDFWIMGDALLWQAIEEKLTYIYAGTPLGTTPNDHSLHTVSFDWNWGYRVGAGYDFGRDGWDLALYWTHVHSTADGSKRAHSNQSLFPATSSTKEILTLPILKASAHLHIDLDQVDLQLGREAFVGKHLTLRPFIGMRSTWLFQEFDVHLANALAQSQKDHFVNQFWGYGFSCGIDMDWLFKKGFSLYANADYALLLGFFKINEKGRQDGTVIWNVKDSFRAGRSIFDIAMGLKWSGLFCKDRFGLTFKSGYEYHMYFNQNQFSGGKASVASLDQVSSQGGNLVYQGVIGSVQFDF